MDTEALRQLNEMRTHVNSRVRTAQAELDKVLAVQNSLDTVAELFEAPQQIKKIVRDLKR